VLAAAGGLELFLVALESLLRKTREKKDIFGSELSGFSSAERRGQHQDSGMVVDDAQRPNY
jgi:hypothetical protein